MAEPEEDWFDEDIAAMHLGYGEKAGLQIYRNYTRSFEEHAIKKFVEVIDQEPLDLSDFRSLSGLIVKEELRFLPVIVCAFADDLLKATFKAVLPDGIPGGKGHMFGGYGPLSGLSNRIKLAYAFDVFSPDLMVELDRLHDARNTISHSWDIDSLKDFFVQGRFTEMVRMEELLSEDDDLAEEFSGKLKPMAAFRIRLIWIVGRLVYEAAAYNRVKKARLRPAHVLYGESAPKWLGEISKFSLEATREIAKQD